MLCESFQNILKTLENEVKIPYKYVHTGPSTAWYIKNDTQHRSSKSLRQNVYITLVRSFTIESRVVKYLRVF